MNFYQPLRALCILAAMTSAGWSQIVPTPIVYRSPVGSPAAASGASPFYPTQVAQAYGLATLQGGIGTGATQNNGAGQTIAIIDAYNYPSALSALNTFSAGFNGAWTLPAMSASGTGPTFTQLNQNGGTSLPGTDPAGAGNDNWEDEEALDFEYVHAMAPKANIILYEANSDSNSDLCMPPSRPLPTIRAVSVVTMNWSGPESSSDLLNNSLYTTPGTKAAMNKGVTFCRIDGRRGRHKPRVRDESSSGFPATSPNRRSSP